MTYTRRRIVCCIDTDSVALFFSYCNVVFFLYHFGMGAILSCLRLLFNMGHIVCHGALGDSVRIDSLSRLEG